MNIENSSIKKPMRLHLFLIFLLFSITATPYLNSEVPTIVNLILLCTWFFYAIVTLSKRQLVIDFTIIYFILFTLLILIYYFIGYTTAPIGNIYNQIAFFSIVFIFYYTDLNVLEKNKKYLCVLLLLVSIFNVVDNIRLNIIYPNASEFVINLDLFPYLKGKNVGSTIFNMFTLIFFDISFILFQNTKKLIKKFLYALILVSTAYYIIFCGMRATIVVLLILSVILLLITRNETSFTAKLYIKIFLLVIFMLMILLFSSNIFNFLAGIMPSERLELRFRELSTLTRNELQDSSFSGRYGLFTLSWSSFSSSIKSMILGIGDHRSTGGYIGYIESGIGGHSELIDVLARYGILGFLLVVGIMKGVYKITIRPFKDKNCLGQIKSIWIIFFIMCIIKSVMYPLISIAMFMLLPLSASLLED